MNDVLRFAINLEYTFENQNLNFFYKIKILNNDSGG